MALIAYLMEHKNNYGPHLIIVPNAVMVNWKSELTQWLPSVRAQMQSLSTSSAGHCCFGVCVHACAVYRAGTACMRARAFWQPCGGMMRCP
jgi:hypothetical protein